MQSTINLLRPAEKDSVQVLSIKEEARTITLIIFIICVIIGIITLFLSIILNMSLKTSQTTNASLKKQIQEYKQIESMLAVIKTRTSVIEKALEYSKPIDVQIGYLNEIASPPVLQEFKIDESEKMTVIFNPKTIEESMSIAGIIIQHAEENHLKNPRIESYGFDKDGMRIMFSYLPVWGQP